MHYVQSPVNYKHRMPIAASTILLIVHIVLAQTASAQTGKAQPSEPRNDEVLQRRISPLVARHRGQVAVMVQHLERPIVFAVNQNQVMPTASLIKMAVMLEAYRQAEAGKLALLDKITLRQEDKVPGSGILTGHFSAGTQLSVQDAIRLMIAYSDNTATNLVLDRIGLEATARTMTEMGWPNTKIHAKVFRRDSSVFPQRSRQYGLGSTTASETVQLLAKLQKGELVSKSASAAMLQHLKNCQSKRLTRNLPAGTVVAHKTGSVSKVRAAAGIIYSPGGPIAVCILTSENADRSWTDENKADRLCSEIARIAFQRFLPKDSGSQAPPATLQVGDGGRLVEDLQRTLNARLKPSADLSIDGDFGPATRAAVIRFQEQNGLAANGIVDAGFWKKLGTLVTSDKVVVPEPSAVNSQQLTKSPAEPLSGSPFTTCKAWAVMDGKTGKILWEQDASRALDMASTTKIMTAVVVLRQAAVDKKVLQEEVVFSRRADRTAGSTSGIREGERLTVAELLYGLLLPSGNDASIALAEHFGTRLASQHVQTKPTKQTEPLDPLDVFVAEMNKVAKELDLRETSFANPHGLTARHHRSSARDLCRLAQQALKNPRFRAYVSTRQHGSTVTGASGYRRNVLWKNTNQLLATEGYFGVKTGTTSAAGACLVSAARRGNHELILTVLGASGSPARYADSRNLYRWAFSQLNAPQ